MAARRHRGRPRRHAVVYRFDRLTRRVSDWTRPLERFRRHDVGFSVVAGEPMAGGSALLQLRLNVLAIFAEWERDMIGERLSHNRAAQAVHGLRSSGEVPFGYTSDEHTKQLKIVEEQAHIFRWFESARPS